MAKKKSKNEKESSKKFEGLDVKINQFGEIVSSVDVSDLNKFLDDNLEDKKLNNKSSKKDKK